MAKLILMCGLPGSGKTTLAKRLEIEENALRLTPDEWITPLYGPNLTQEKLDSVRDPVESVQWQVSERAIAMGCNVILDFGFWSRSERDGFRAKAHELGASSEVRFLDVSLDELWARLEARNANLPEHAFAISREQIEEWWRMFEAPSADELKIRS